MSGNHFFTRIELERILMSVKDLTLGQADKNHVFDRTITKPKITGIAGDVIEQSVLGYPADQSQSPDLDVDGIPTELKTTGMRLKRSANGYVYEAKEPASVTAVSIDSIANETFPTSNFWCKAEHMLFVFYQYESRRTVLAAEYADFHIRGFCFNEFSDDDKLILQQDWQIIHDFIASIQAHYDKEEAKSYYPLLSTQINQRTTYLDTAPKYPNAPRFRLRRRVVTFIIQKTFNGEHFEQLPGQYHGRSDIERKCAALTEAFHDWSMQAILEHFGVNVKPGATKKQYAEQVIVRMFGGTAKKISKIEMFTKLGYIGKSITLTTNNRKTEDTKLLSVDFDELEEEMFEDETGILREKEFEDSDLYHYLHDNKLLFAVFQEPQSSKGEHIELSENKFKGFKILDLSDDLVITEARRTWEKARQTIKSNELKEYVPSANSTGNGQLTMGVKAKGGAPNFPKSRDYLIFFRGTGQNAQDKKIVHGVPMYRQSYWIRGSYLADKLNETPLLD